MIKSRSPAIFVFWGVLLAAPFIYAQGVKPSEERTVLQPLPMTLELPSQRFLDFMLRPAPGFGAVDSGTGSFQLPGVSIGNEPACGSKTSRHEAI